MSVEAGGSIENLMEGINTSNESISSIIPFEKREELSRFELTLKQMIDEAKQMAATPSGSEEDIYASLHKSPSVSSFTNVAGGLPLPYQNGTNLGLHFFETL